MYHKKKINYDSLNKKAIAIIKYAARNGYVQNDSILIKILGNKLDSSKKWLKERKKDIKKQEKIAEEESLYELGRLYPIFNSETLDFLKKAISQEQGYTK